MKAGELLFYFVAYSGGGWLLEHLYCKWTTGHYQQEGFLFGPFKPMYGLAPLCILLLANRVEMTWGGMVLLCLLVPTFVEALSGWMLDKAFNRRYWDYSQHQFQWRGYICLRFSFYWLLLSLLVLYGLHPLLAALYVGIEPVWLRLEPLVALYVAADIVLSSLRHSRWQRSSTKIN